MQREKKNIQTLTEPEISNIFAKDIKTSVLQDGLCVSRKSGIKGEIGILQDMKLFVLITEKGSNHEKETFKSRNLHQGNCR